ncbi:TPA: amino acid ABC transporter substrate-binding protein [Burkholderia aenigmatica]|uniref:amino acid ABC transporter substrate-binding protein n=1 Tax=Burkholderia sp. AU45251 TaxID=3059204 RepID=UPI00264C7163|nr:amino acid ABC transporter substrate-binding protein [Burkholderia sp. AU45251]HDR9481980.1 amino acid ABC transporter substrate-binding protein [Burkholderia aenigmatica]MDN7515388.1 amino acid ABC transporter substrate-binding protein [Burkholderia sp. AU45251]HDR9515447.1 amino acid ABC transporter substrate-binding protein [Burkholderia aenigmatica]HDR9590351.1 amino acid ABC transporter substrate-binding protein [Burkholderia aenigmatica]HDR9598724.1 amino acid ABC transporter substrat
MLSITNLRLALVFVLAIAATSQVVAADEIVIGASLPLSGPLAGFGAYQKWGYETAVNDVNKNGGLDVGGTRHKIKLVIRDDKTDPNSTASNTETLISRDGAVAMLGSCTPALVNAGALVAERRKVPIVSGCDPLSAFKSVRQWKYAWDIFFDEGDLGTAPFRMLADYRLETNKKIAIFSDNGPDGKVVGGVIWPNAARQGGFTVEQQNAFPVDAQQFTSMISQAKADDVHIALVDAIPPQAIAMRKQMVSANFQPKILVMEKGAEPEQFARALGRLSDGILVGGYWDPCFPYPGAADLGKRFESEMKQTQSQHIADSYTAAQVLLDAIAQAGSVDREKINDAIGKTNKTYVVGPVAFDAAHTSKIPIALMQWQGGKALTVWPKDRANGKLVFPLPVAH